MIVVDSAVLGDLVDQYGGSLDVSLERSLPIHTLGASDEPGQVDLAPVFSSRFARNIVASSQILLVESNIADEVPAGRRWVHPKARHVLAALLGRPEEPVFLDTSSFGGLFPDVRIDPTARIGVDVSIQPGSVIEPYVVIYPHVRIGSHVRIGTHSVIGRVGFGYLPDLAVRIAHRAGVVLEDRVELGAHNTVDAGVLRATRIGRETLFDAHIHVGHSVQIGCQVRVAAQVGFAGSCHIGDCVWIGGQAGFGEHVTVGNNARIAGKSGVIGDIPEGSVVAGYPAVARARWLRGHARLYRGR